MVRASIQLSLVLISSHLAWAAQRCCSEMPGLCFDDSPPFDHMPLPDCPGVLQVGMRVYSRYNIDNGEELVVTAIPKTWRPERRTHILVHGWLGGQNTWMETMKQVALDRVDMNVVIVEWPKGAQHLWYPRSASDTRSVGAHIAAVFDNLVRNGGANPADFYCAGHSLGSHVCGHAGAYSQSLFGFTMGRITGLDPAGPLFESRDWSVGLNPSCASFVDVMHTNGGPGLILNLGTMRLLGHVDFYPNGGETQPGCMNDPSDLDRLMEKDLENDTNILMDMSSSCSHVLALDFYMESIRNSCFLSHHICTDQHDMPGSCQQSSHPLQSMGFDADDRRYVNRGIFYLQTHIARPFCKN